MSVNSPYLNGLNRTNVSGPFSLRDCFPAKDTTQFVYYTTCLAPSTADGVIHNAVTCVNIEGLYVDSSVISGLASEIAAIGSFPVYNPEFLVHTSSKLRVLQTQSEFLQYCLTTTDLLNYAGLSAGYQDPNHVTRTDTTDAYKCVPLDPDTMIQNGQLSVDISKGIPLTAVNSQRTEIQSQLKSSFQWIVDLDLQQYMSSGIGILLVVLLILGVVLGVLSMFYGNHNATPGTLPAAYTSRGYEYQAGVSSSHHGPGETMKRTIFFLIVGIGLSLFGFLIGYMVFTPKAEPVPASASTNQ